MTVLQCIDHCQKFSILSAAVSLWTTLTMTHLDWPGFSRLIFATTMSKVSLVGSICWDVMLLRLFQCSYNIEKERLIVLYSFHFVTYYIVVFFCAHMLLLLLNRVPWKFHSTPLFWIVFPSRSCNLTLSLSKLRIGVDYVLAVWLEIIEVSTPFCKWDHECTSQHSGSCVYHVVHLSNADAAYIRQTEWHWLKSHLLQPPYHSLWTQTDCTDYQKRSTEEWNCYQQKRRTWTFAGHMTRCTCCSFHLLCWEQFELQLQACWCCKSPQQLLPACLYCSHWSWVLSYCLWLCRLQDWCLQEWALQTWLVGT